MSRKHELHQWHDSKNIWKIQFSFFLGVTIYFRETFAVMTVIADKV